MPIWLRRLLIVAFIILPPALFLILGGRHFLPEQGFWAFVAILGVISGWIVALAGLVQITGITLRELWKGGKTTSQPEEPTPPVSEPATSPIPSPPPSQPAIPAPSFDPRPTANAA